MEEEYKREMVMREEEEQIEFDPTEPFVDRHIAEAEVLRRYIDMEKVKGEYFLKLSKKERKTWKELSVGN